MQAWNRHDLEGYLSFFTADACYIGPRRRVDGILAIREYMAMLIGAFPILRPTALPPKNQSSGKWRGFSRLGAGIAGSSALAA